jgi:hypothetical protein
MNSREDLIWGGGLIGVHTGRCLFVETDTCQQYLDGIVGIATRESETQTHLWASLRWQYVNVPDRHSTFWRLFGGAASLQKAETRGWKPVGGAGFGVITYLHDKVDLRLEARGLASDRLYGQALIGVHIKADRLLTVFARKLRDLGYGTFETAVEATGTAIKATGEVVEGVASPFKDEKPQTPQKPK